MLSGFPLPGQRLTHKSCAQALGSGLVGGAATNGDCLIPREAGRPPLCLPRAAWPARKYADYFFFTRLGSFLPLGVSRSNSSTTFGSISPRAAIAWSLRRWASDLNGIRTSLRPNRSGVERTVTSVNAPVR